VPRITLGLPVPVINGIFVAVLWVKVRVKLLLVRPGMFRNSVLDINPSEVWAE